MKIGAIVLTASVAFTLGFLVRGVVLPDSDATVSSESESIRPVPENTESIELARSSGDSVETSTLSDAGTRYEVEFSSEALDSRRFYKRQRIGEFFVIRNIGEEQADQIVDGLIQVDLYIAAMRQSMTDRHIAASGEALSQEEKDRVELTEDEKRLLHIEEEALYRQVLDGHFAAHQDYERKHLQWQTVSSLSNSLAQPLDFATKENLVEIMHEEQVTMNSVMGPFWRDMGLDLRSQQEVSRRRIEAMISYNEKVLRRVEPYLTNTQFDLLKSRLEKDVRRYELTSEIADIDDTY